MRLFTLLTFVFLGSGVFAQRDPIITAFWNNYSIFNPATSGLEFKHQATVTYRNQWDKVSGAPKSLFANYNTLLGKHHGVGINYTYETIGYSKGRYLHLNYNYQFKIDDDRKISLGISPGLYNINVKGNYWPEPTAPISLTYISFNGGIAYKGKSIYTGIGVTHFVELQKYKSLPFLTHDPHLYVHFRKEHKIRKSKLYVEGIYRTDFVKSKFDINVRAVFFNKLTLGSGFRFSEAIMLFGSWDFNEKFRLGYAYDFQMHLLTAVQGGHEITLGFNIPHSIKSRSMSMPNF